MGPLGNWRQGLPKCIDCIRIGNFTRPYTFILSQMFQSHCFNWVEDWCCFKN